MKNYWAIVGFILFLVISFTQAIDLDTKEKQIKELEFELWQLKLDRHTDSLINNRVSEFRKKLGLPPR